MKNLISYGILDKQGFNYSGGVGQIKVLKGALTIMKVKLQYKIYTLMGNSVIGTLSVSSTLDQYDDCTEL
jgi:hypothetical protein